MIEDIDGIEVRAGEDYLKNRENFDEWKIRDDLTGHAMMRSATLYTRRIKNLLIKM